jgi:hypothetical protein
VGFEPTRERYPLPVFKTGALNHSATLPCQQDQSLSRSPIRTSRERLGQNDPNYDPMVIRLVFWELAHPCLPPDSFGDIRRINAQMGAQPFC